MQSLYSKLPPSPLAKAEPSSPLAKVESPVDVPFLSAISPDATYYPLPDSPASQFPSPSHAPHLSGELDVVWSTGSGSWGSEEGPQEQDLDGSPVDFEVAEATYADVGFPLLPYDSVEFQTLRDHNLHPSPTLLNTTGSIVYYNGE
jgi:hypothetical protein